VSWEVKSLGTGIILAVCIIGAYMLGTVHYNHSPVGKADSSKQVPDEPTYTLSNGQKTHDKDLAKWDLKMQNKKFVQDATKQAEKEGEFDVGPSTGQQIAHELNRIANSLGAPGY
jgi:hypothetical protein